MPDEEQALASVVATDDAAPPPPRDGLKLLRLRQPIGSTSKFKMRAAQLKQQQPHRDAMSIVNNKCHHHHHHDQSNRDKSKLEGATSEQVRWSTSERQTMKHKLDDDSGILSANHHHRHHQQQQHQLRISQSSHNVEPPSQDKRSSFGCFISPVSSSSSSSSMIEEERSTSRRGRTRRGEGIREPLVRKRFRNYYDGATLIVGPAAAAAVAKFISLAVIIIILTFCANETHSYQLANNLIANNSPPKFIASTLSSGGSSSSAAAATATATAASPQSNSEIVVRVKEGPASIGKLIYTLKGEDPDDDPLTFGVLGSMGSDLLRIENVPGNQANVYLRKELDRETTESYQMVITLTDGKLGRGNWVEDINDNYPVFGAHRTAISVREDSRVPLVIESVEATDQDEGRFGQVIYRLEELDADSAAATAARSGASGQGNGRPAQAAMFAIDTIDGKGVISLMQRLDYEQKALYQLRVTAIDRAVEQERLAASTSILVSVEDCPDRPPLFTFVPSITRIPENLPVGSPVVRVAAVDGDRGINNPIEYKLVALNGQPPDQSGLFAIDAESGLISVARELDRESGSSYFNAAGGQPASAYEGDRPQAAATGDGQPGSYVIQVRATERTGAGAAALDESASVTTELTIILTDVNDELPSFDRAHYYGEILENSAPESLVSFVAPAQPADGPPPGQQQQLLPSAKVIDRDQGTNGTFTLHLEGEQAHLFDVWPREATNEANFMIKVSAGASAGQLAALDFERNRRFQFTIVAREKYPPPAGSASRRSSSAQMTVQLKDFNDNYPQFDSELYRVEIPENAIKGMHICAIKATDPDSGALGSAGIRYTELRGEQANKFKLDPISGAITLRTSEHGFDRETMAQHHLIAEARDANGAGNRNTTQLVIILADVNDQRPKFLLDQYEAFIYENEPDFQSPLQVQAIDLDAANTSNSRITYSIVDGDPQHNFTIDPQSGRIRVRSSLIIPPLPPAPSRGSFGDDSTITTTTDGGIGLPAGESDQQQQQQPQPQPVAQVAGGLDFERIAQKRDESRQFNLTVRATDSGLPEPLYGQTSVLVLVYDRNDHAPVFTRNVYARSIREDAREGSQVCQVLAHDGDHSPANSRISYRISSGAADKFVIDSESGLISVASGANLDIDRATGGGQKRANYLLSVLAFDGSFGPHQKSASALVNISIIDVNNKAPEFVTLGQAATATAAAGSSVSLKAPLGGASVAHTGASATTLSSLAGAQQQQQVVYVNEDAPYGLIVTRVLAMDLDSGAELRYSINYARSEARNEDMLLVDPTLVRDLFSIEPLDGTIKVARQLDRELFDQVKLRLQVEDIAAQTADQVAHAYLLIRITDVNDNRPTFKRPVYKAVVNENSIGGTSVITLAADDRDLNKTLKYSLDGSPEMMRLVRINSRSGEVTVNDKIDRELYPMINVTVRAEDYGHPHPLTGYSQLLITVRDENDNNPIFWNGSQSSHLQPTAPPHSTRALGNHLAGNESLSGAGAGVGVGGHTRLRSLGKPPPPPAVDELAGVAGGAGGLPLLAPGATAWVREDAPIGAQVAYVRADDADLGNNGRVTYLLDSSSSGAKFRIDRDSGIISVAGQLDREASERYTLIIEACDNYDLGYSTGESRRAFAQVNIQLADINDNAPIISTNLRQHHHDTQAPPGGGGQPAQSAGLNQQQPQQQLQPSFEDVIQSAGPYRMPLPDCLFISEFQALNEPILTVIAHDADDPSTANGQVDLAIVNGANLPQNELFALVAADANRQAAATSATTSTNADRYQDAATTFSSVPTTTTTTTTTIIGDDGFGGAGDLIPDESRTTVINTSDEANNEPIQSAAGADPKVMKRKRRRRRRRQAGDVEFSLEPANFYPQRPTLQTFKGPKKQHLVGSSSFKATTSTEQPPSITTATHMPSGNNNRPGLKRISGADSSEQQQQQRQQQTIQHLIVSQSLREKVGNYSVLVRATDGGGLSSARLINICVQDVNNHAPVFVRPPLNHTIRVLENATVGSFVVQVEATDLDHGQNGELQYALKATNIQNSEHDWQSFRIDRSTGIVSTSRPFNRQLKKYYTLRVQAQDLGRPTSLSSDIDINIMIVNSGQYQPEFEAPQAQQVQFTENVSPGIEWFALVPTINLDDDPALIYMQQQQPQSFAGDSSNKPVASNSNGSSSSKWLTSPCYFIIDSDDHEQAFHLDRYTHRLTNQRVLDRERKANYTLLIQATNQCNKAPPAPSYGGRGPQAAPAAYDGQPAPAPQPTTSSPIPYLDSTSAAGGSQQQQSQQAQQFEYRSGSLSLPAAARSRRSLGAAAAAASSGANSSSTDATSGVNAPIGFTQAAVDSLLAVDKSLLKVVVKVKDVNDNAPKFTQKVYTGGITTEADFGTTFMIVQALDADADANGQVVYSIVKPIKLRSSSGGGGGASAGANNGQLAREARSRRDIDDGQLLTMLEQQQQQQPAGSSRVAASDNAAISSSTNEATGGGGGGGDDLFVINAQTGEISLNFDPQRHMKGYFEFEIMANDTDGLFDSARVFIYLLRQDQRVKFVLRLTPQELRQRLNKFRSVFGNITGAIVNIDSYKYFENHDGTVDKKKTSLYLHFVSPDDNTIIDVDKVLTMIDNNIEYLDELYKEFHVLSSEAAHLPLSSSALVDPMTDQIRTGLLGVSSFLTLILVLVIVLCINQRTRYERQLKAATVSAFGGAGAAGSQPLRLDPDYQGQSNLPNTNLHSQDPNPIWMSGFVEQDWLGGGGGGSACKKGGASGPNGGAGGRHNQGAHHEPEMDYLSSAENSDDLNSLNGGGGGHANAAANQQHSPYNAATTATPRDSLSSSQGGRVSGSNSGSSSTTNERQFLCGSSAAAAASNTRSQTPYKVQPGQGGPVLSATAASRARPELVSVLKSHNNSNKIPANGRAEQQQQQQQAASQPNSRSHNSNNNNNNNKHHHQQLMTDTVNTHHHSTFGAFKEVTIYSEQPSNQFRDITTGLDQHQHQQQHQTKQQQQQTRLSNSSSLAVAAEQQQQQQQQTSQVNKIASQFNAKRLEYKIPQSFVNQPNGNQNNNGRANCTRHQKVLVHANNADVSQGIIKSQQQQQQRSQQAGHLSQTIGGGGQHKMADGSSVLPVLVNRDDCSAEQFESNLSKLIILNLETTEL